MKILVLGLSDPYYAPMLCGFLNYYLPDNTILYTGDQDALPHKKTVKLMESVGIDVNKPISKRISTKNIDAKFIVISSSQEVKEHIMDQGLFKENEIHHLGELLSDSLSDKESKKSLKQARKRIQKFSEQLVEEITAS